MYIEHSGPTLDSFRSLVDSRVDIANVSSHSEELRKVCVVELMSMVYCGWIQILRHQMMVCLSETQTSDACLVTMEQAKCQHVAYRLRLNLTRRWYRQRPTHAGISLRWSLGF